MYLEDTVNPVAVTEADQIRGIKDQNQICFYLVKKKVLSLYVTHYKKKKIVWMSHKAHY